MKKIINLNDSWYIRKIPNTERLSAEKLEEYGAGSPEELGCTLPAQVHETLLRHGKIEDPTAAGNCEKCRWVAESDWIYRRSFRLGEAGKRTRLLFKGLDTYADIYLNGILVGSSEDQYLPKKVDVTGLVKGDNSLIVHFHSPIAHMNVLKLPKAWENKIERNRMLRKSLEDLEGFLGPQPYLANVGIFDDVLVEAADGIELQDLDLDVALHDGLKKGVVGFRAAGAGKSANAVVDFEIKDQGGVSCARAELALKEGAGESWEVGGELTVDAPKLWWPRTHGAQPLYTVEARLLEDGVTRDVIQKRIGFRECRMIGRFNYLINGVPVKLWGANLAPMKRITNCWDSGIAARLLDMTENANMNLLRVWGQGVPCPDELYDEADSRGLLLWQEFHTCYGMVPNDSKSREFFKREAEYEVKKLKHHASILLWCGGNESPMGAEYDSPGQVCTGREVFEEDMRDVCARLDPARYYHPNSPYGGEFSNDPLEGDSHGYTHMWYVPGQDYPVLLSENTRISTPGYKSMKRYLGGAPAWPDGFDGKVCSNSQSPLPDTWMDYAPAGVKERIRNIEKFYDADGPEALAYRMGSAHALHLSEVVERCRRGKPSEDAFGRRRCMGHIVWKLNEPWPAFYSSMIDYYLEGYIPYYTLKRAYQPALVSLDIGNHIYVWVVNDTGETIEGRVTARLYDPKNNLILDEMSKPVSVDPDESLIAFSLDKFGQFRRENFIYACLTDASGNVISRTNGFVDIERNLCFPNPKLGIREKDGVLTVTTDRFARCVELTGDESGDEFGWFFEDNYFDLFPWEEKKIRILGSHKKGTVKAKAHFSDSSASVEL